MLTYVNQIQVNKGHHYNFFSPHLNGFSFLVLSRNKISCQCLVYMDHKFIQQLLTKLP